MKIKLKELKMEDAKEILKALKETDFAHNRMTSDITLQEEKAWLKKAIKKTNQEITYEYKITYKDKFLGIISLRINQDKKYLGDVGYWIRKSEQGKGFATEATKQIVKKAKRLKLSGLTAIADPKNLASRKVLAKNGFSEIGLLKKHIKVKGKLKDRFFYWKILS